MAKLQGKDKELADKIQALLSEYGYSTQRYFVSHDAFSARFTINTAKVVKDSSGNVDPFARAKSEFISVAAVIGFKVEWLGKTIVCGGKTYVFEGYDLGKRSKPCVLSRDGKTYHAPEEQIKSLLSKVA